MKEELSHQNSLLNIFKSDTETRTSPPVFLVIEDDDLGDPPAFKGKCLLLKYHLFFHFIVV